MSAVRDGQDADPQDSSRIIYRFRQSVSSSTSFLSFAISNSRSVPLFFSPAPPFFFYSLQQSVSSSFSPHDISTLQQVPMPSYLIAIVAGALESRYLSLHVCPHVCLYVYTFKLPSDWSTGRSALAPESGQRRSLWTRQRLNSQRLALLTPLLTSYCKRSPS